GGVALAKPKNLERQTERIGRDLGIGRLMALAVGMGADLDVDVALFGHLQLGDLVGLAARGFDEAGIAETTQLAPLARIALARLEAFRCLDRMIDRVAEAALLDRQPHRRAMRKAANDVLAPQL